MLHERGVHIIQKPFAIGARIEHPQELFLINKSQYKDFHNHPRLGAADYRLIGILQMEEQRILSACVQEVVL